MASPFEIFRKNQRLWMAAAVLVAIIAFVIAPMLEYFTGGNNPNGRSGPNPVVASWSGGAMRVNQVEQDQSDLQLVNRFLRELYAKVEEKGGVPKVPSFYPQQNMFGIMSYMNVIEPEAIIQRRLLQTEAQRMGIQFDESAVTQFLQRFVDGKLDGKTIQKIMVSSTDRQLTMPMFQRVMQDELVYQEMLRLTRAGLTFEDVRSSQIVGIPTLTTPSKNWREFLRLNRTSKVKAYPVYAKDFIAEVKTKPTDKELKDLYNAGSSLIRMSNTLDTAPAFMSPATADVEYVSIDTEKYIQEEMAKIPEETLRAEYDRRVAEKQFRVPIEVEKKAPAELPGAPSSDASTEKPTDTGTPNSDPPAEEKTEVETKPAVDPEPPKSSQWNPNQGQIKLVAYQEEKKPAATSPENPLRDAPTAQQKDAPEPASKESQPAEPKPADGTKPQDEKPAETTEETKPAGEQPPAGEMPELPTLPLSIGESTPIAKPTDVADVTPMRTQTFEEVKDRIAREMATATATRIVEEKVNEVYGMMNIYQSELQQYLRAKQAKDPDAVLPEKLDLRKIATEFGFDYAATGMVDSETIMFHPLGQSAVSLNPRAQPVPIAAFIQATKEQGAEWTPIVSTSRSGQSTVQYLSWKTTLTEPSVPSYEACKEKVMEVWTAQQALKLAEAKASELASRVGSGEIEDILSSEEEKKKVAETVPFTAMNPMYPMFMRFNMQAQMDEVGQVSPLLPVDMNFMESVFSKKPGETTIAPDRRKSVIYVLKILEMGDTKELLTKFQASPAESVSALVSRDNERAIGPLMDGIRKRLGYRAN